MKRAEIIRNVAVTVALGATSVSMFAGFITGLLTTTENAVSAGLALSMIVVAFVMNEISK